jgi:hypothetical protein
MLLTVERFISVRFPLKARTICTLKWTYVALLVMFICSFALNLQFYFILTLDNNGRCNLTARMAWYGDISHWIDMFVYSLVPFVVIVFCNCSILSKVIQSRIERKKLQQSERSSEAKSTHAHLTSMTYMLTTVSVVFLILTLPTTIQLVVYEQLRPRTAKQYVVYALMHTTTNLLSYTNSAINFILYCVSGTQFRREVYNLFQGLRFSHQN